MSERKVRMSKAKVDQLVRIGAMMANVCFNLSQHASVRDDYRLTMRDLCARWDEAMRVEVREVKARKSGKGKRRGK